MVHLTYLAAEAVEDSDIEPCRDSVFWISLETEPAQCSQCCALESRCLNLGVMLSFALLLANTLLLCYHSCVTVILQRFHEPSKLHHVRTHPNQPDPTKPNQTQSKHDLVEPNLSCIMCRPRQQHHRKHVAVFTLNMPSAVCIDYDPIDDNTSEDISVSHFHAMSHLTTTDESVGVFAQGLGWHGNRTSGTHRLHTAFAHTPLPLVSLAATSVHGAPGVQVRVFSCAHLRTCTLCFCAVVGFS